MPKGFSELEKETIRRLLIEKGAVLFGTYGIKKTSVEDISRAVGISKGAFYLFYSSKEDLLLDIHEKIQTDLRASLLNYTISPEMNARQNTRAMLEHFLKACDKSLPLKNLSQSDYALMLRKIPAERVEAHLHEDDEFVLEFLTKIEQDGIPVKAPAHLVSNLMKCLFLILLHREDFGESYYRESLDVMTDLIAGYIVNGQ